MYDIMLKLLMYDKIISIVFKRLMLKKISILSSVKMCILFLYNGAKVDSSDYSLILVSNRDEFYKRPTLNLAPWTEDPNVIGGRDLESGIPGGTWLAISVLRKKIGVLLNLPRQPKQNAISRGKIVEDFAKCDTSARDYVDDLRKYVDNCNQFIFIAVELSNHHPTISCYSNETDSITPFDDVTLGFSNSLPNIPLKKAEAGKRQLEEICTKYGRGECKDELVNELLRLLKSKERHSPDPEIQKWRPQIDEQLSSIFVSIPEFGYGTRTHTIILITKEGQIDIIEDTLQSPIDLEKPNWQRTELQYSLQRPEG